MAPVGPVDRELVAPLPSCCPDCGGEICFEREAEQFQTELPERRPTVTRFTVGVGHCTSCKRRVQGRHPEQTSDALGAAASQVGPNAMSLATRLHYVMGLSFKKSAAVLGHLGVPVTAGALSSSAQSTGTDLVPVHQEILSTFEAVDAAADAAGKLGARFARNSGAAERIVCSVESSAVLWRCRRIEVGVFRS
ncbi:MAG: hypothetical protein ACYDC0_06325 [Acidimicrobiales bacterium]